MAEAMRSKARADDSVSAPFWDAAREGRLVLQVGADGSVSQYPRSYGLDAATEPTGWVDSSGSGVVHAFTVIHVGAPEEFTSEVPYIVGLVDLDEGVRMLVRIEAGPGTFEVGSPIVVGFDALPDGRLQPVGRMRPPSGSGLDCPIRAAPR